MSSKELSPYRYLVHTMDLWWIVFLAAFLGGGLGYMFFLVRHPVYEATATFYVRIDLATFPMKGVRDDLLQYNEDMAVNVTSQILLSRQVLNDVASRLKPTGLIVSASDLLNNYTIERKLDLWELRYRSQVPATAQAIVNTWAEIGYQAMLTWHSTGQAQSFVIFQPPSQAILPAKPVLYGRNNLMLAGALIGLIAGTIITNRISRTSMEAPQKK
jgi:capsular polysaccharide biosynthesis protein